jgi:hydroxymethylglutaryl-CoA reductase (NADPH)
MSPHGPAEGSMPTASQQAKTYLDQLLADRSEEELRSRLRPRSLPAPPASVPGKAQISADIVDQRWKVLGAGAEVRSQLLDEHTAPQMQVYARNIEHFVGAVKIPLGVVGPLRVNGLFAAGDYYVPLATTEAALVASYSRGAMLVTEAGGASAMLLNEGVSRSPGFAFTNLEEVGVFLNWVLASQDEIRRAAEATTHHGQLVNLQITVEGNHVYLVFTFSTGDAAGQNMTTIATEAAVGWIVEHSPVKPRATYVEANFSGDKKASTQSLQSVRGRKVVAEVIVPADLVQQRLHTSPDRMADYARIATMGGVLSGTVGVQGHYANGLAALFIACGQDAACVAEAAVGITRYEVTGDGSLYASVTLPNLIVGTVGGGTKLPSQRACLEILGLAGTGHARAFAEVAAALCLAGELSIVGALCAGEFTRSHVSLARGGAET